MKMICDSCGSTVEVNREDTDVHADVHEIHCNYCPNCEENHAGDYWEEYFLDKDGNEMIFDVIDGEVVNITNQYL